MSTPRHPSSKVHASTLSAMHLVHIGSKAGMTARRMRTRARYCWRLGRAIAITCMPALWVGVTSMVQAVIIVNLKMWHLPRRYSQNRMGIPNAFAKVAYSRNHVHQSVCFTLSRSSSTVSSGPPPPWPSHSRPPPCRSSLPTACLSQRHRPGHLSSA